MITKICCTCGKSFECVGRHCKTPDSNYPCACLECFIEHHHESLHKDLTKSVYLECFDKDDNFYDNVSVSRIL